MSYGYVTNICAEVVLKLLFDCEIKNQDMKIYAANLERPRLVYDCETFEPFAITCLE